MNRTTNPVFQIPYIGETLKPDYLSLFEQLKRLGVAVDIDKINWPEYSYAPLVKLFIGYTDAYLWLCYEVKGDFFRARAAIDQEAVWEDCCVEFFVSANQNKGRETSLQEEIVYRNFEFNVLGVLLSACGTKKDRISLAVEEMDRILRYPEFYGEKLPQEGSLCDWGLCVAIPLDLIGLQRGSRFEGNFQKCGDFTRAPHFLTWNAIISDEPDFHLPQFFGEMELVN